MPTGAVQDHEDIVVGILGSDLCQEDAHGVGVDAVGDQRGELSIMRTNGGKGVQVFSDVL